MISRKYIVILLYICCVLLIFYFKPAMMFDTIGNIKQFNYEENDKSSSLLNIELVLTVIALLCFFIILSMELVFTK